MGAKREALALGLLKRGRENCRAFIIIIHNSENMKYMIFHGENI